MRTALFSVDDSTVGALAVAVSIADTTETRALVFEKGAFLGAAPSRAFSIAKDWISTELRVPLADRELTAKLWESERTILFATTNDRLRRLRQALDACGDLTESASHIHRSYACGDNVKQADLTAALTLLRDVSTLEKNNTVLVGVLVDEAVEWSM